MKKLLFLLSFALLISISVKSQTGRYYLYCDSTKEVIKCTAMDNIHNDLRYDKADSTGKITESGVVYWPQMWVELDDNQVEASDVGLSGRSVIYNFGLALGIYKYNLLNLNLSKWTLKETE